MPQGTDRGAPRFATEPMMMNRLTLSATLLLGASILSGCTNDPGAAAGTETQSQRAPPAPGGFVVHLNSDATSEVVVTH
jgi:hypothetical protein